ncbi:Metalloprotease [Coniophora puteana RWD-64-598 SS2]|uniref:Metalloprotease n=1 Tax=Coniophora puteana (strain RWD-64-598) TaxID=741705 RepID=A0A5M3MJF3_CONPW|nr:Metalloprotease [Coniophora puteana RWD-64-598 SS2]EIW78755.1 Metalloprotease [Coniophora puteana RWD-64-598 SS2]
MTQVTWFLAESLAGPASAPSLKLQRGECECLYIISGYGKREENGKILYDVKFKTPDIFPLCFKFAHNPEVRKCAIEAHEDRLSVNALLLGRPLELHREIAGLLGYKTWADYSTEPKMVKSGKNAEDFLGDLETRLRLLSEKERGALIQLKKEVHGKRGLPFDGIFNFWDYRYYDHIYIKKTLDLDDSLIKEYFPVAVVVVVPAILEIYQKLLGVRFVEVKGDKKDVWHPSIRRLGGQRKGRFGFRWILLLGPLPSRCQVLACRRLAPPRPRYP